MKCKFNLSYNTIKYLFELINKKGGAYKLRNSAKKSVGKLVLSFENNHNALLTNNSLLLSKSNNNLLLQNNYLLNLGVVNSFKNNGATRKILNSVDRLRLSLGLLQRGNNLIKGNKGDNLLKNNIALNVDEVPRNKDKLIFVLNGNRSFVLGQHFGNGKKSNIRLYDILVKMQLIIITLFAVYKMRKNECACVHLPLNFYGDL